MTWDSTPRHLCADEPVSALCVWAASCRLQPPRTHAHPRSRAAAVPPCCCCLAYAHRCSLWLDRTLEWLLRRGSELSGESAMPGTLGSRSPSQGTAPVSAAPGLASMLPLHGFRDNLRSEEGFGVDKLAMRSMHSMLVHPYSLSSLSRTASCRCCTASVCIRTACRSQNLSPHEPARRVRCCDCRARPSDPLSACVAYSQGRLFLQLERPLSRLHRCQRVDARVVGRQLAAVSERSPCVRQLAQHVAWRGAPRGLRERAGAAGRAY